MTKGLFASIVTICFVGLSAGRAFAQFPRETATFMLVPGIPGDSSNEAYDKWIEVAELTQTFDATAKRNVCSLAVNTRLNSAGPRLWAAVVMGELFKQIQVDVVRPHGGGALTKFYEILLVNARVTSIRSSEARVGMEDELTIRAGSVGLKFFPQNADGSIGEPIAASFSCK